MEELPAAPLDGIWGHIHFTAKGDGYIWNESIQGWRPMSQEELIAVQQSAYGNDEVNYVSEENLDQDLLEKKRLDEEVEQLDTRPRKHQKARAADYTSKANPEPTQNKSVYVTNLPNDVSEIEIQAHFSKCGIIMQDLVTGEPRIKIYRDENDECKGDALVTYFKAESVPLACSVLDESLLRPDGPAIHVQEAQFKERSAAQGTGTKVALDKLQFKKRVELFAKKLSWDDEDYVAASAKNSKKAKRYSRVVVLKNMFNQKELDDEPTLVLDLKDEIKQECEKLGAVQTVQVYDMTGDEGLCSVRFETEESARACVKKMHGRFFAGRRIEASIYDGSRKLNKLVKQSSSQNDEEERLEKFASWLEEGSDEELMEQNKKQKLNEPESHEPDAFAATPPPDE